MLTYMLLYECRKGKVNNMKRSEMNAHQKQVFDLVVDTCNFIIGGWENQLDDSPAGSEAYNEAVKALSNHEELVTVIYEEVMRETDARKKRALRFAGTEFTMERIEKRLKKLGY